MSSNKVFNKVFGLIFIIVGVWTNGFMLGAIDRIIIGSSTKEFNIYFIITFTIIIIGIILYNLKELK
ncbi:MAG TPA: hypothetical protein ENG87_01700 [Candidatus Pacearchaeota archaeon]|nr:hypothetical protein [Candidatus Pacearchaeota archaeon]